MDADLGSNQGLNMGDRFASARIIGVTLQTEAYGNDVIRLQRLINRASLDYDRPAVSHLMSVSERLKGVEMNEIARVKKPKYDQRARRARSARKSEHAREKAIVFDDARLSQFECGILAFDRLVRRIANDRGRSQDDSTPSFQLP